MTKLIAIMGLGLLVSACADTVCEQPDLFEPIAHCDTPGNECHWNVD